MTTFKQFLINEEAATAELSSKGLSSQLKQIVNLFLVPVSKDKQEFRKRSLLGREVIHVIEDAIKTAAGKEDFNPSEAKSAAKQAVNNILNPPASAKEKSREKFPSIAAAFNTKVIGYVIGKLGKASSEEVKGMAASLMSEVGETWNEMARRASQTENRGEERQMQRRYTEQRKAGGAASRRQTYKNIEKRATRGGK